MGLYQLWSSFYIYYRLYFIIRYSFHLTTIIITIPLKLCESSALSTPLSRGGIWGTLRCCDVACAKALVVKKISQRDFSLWSKKSHEWVFLIGPPKNTKICDFWGPQKSRFLRSCRTCVTTPPKNLGCRPLGPILDPKNWTSGRPGRLRPVLRCTIWPPRRSSILPVHNDRVWIDPEKVRLWTKLASNFRIIFLWKKMSEKCPDFGSPQFGFFGPHPRKLAFSCTGGVNPDGSAIFSKIEKIVIFWQILGSGFGGVPRKPPDCKICLRRIRQNFAKTGVPPFSDFFAIFDDFYKNFPPDFPITGLSWRLNRHKMAKNRKSRFFGPPQKMQKNAFFFKKSAFRMHNAKYPTPTWKKIARCISSGKIGYAPLGSKKSLL